MPTFTTRPVIMGNRGLVTSGHYLASAAGFRIMAQGGNAIDAAAAMCLCLNLLEPQSNGIGGEVPTLIYSAKEGKTFAISGMGWSPEAFTIDWCRCTPTPLHRRRRTATEREYIDLRGGRGSPVRNYTR